MYVDKTTVTRKNGQKYTRYLLRTSHREGKKTVKTTLLNITHFGVETCEAIKFALSNKGRLNELSIATSDLSIIKARPEKAGSVFRLWVAQDRPEWGAISITAGVNRRIEASLTLQSPNGV